MWLYTGYGVLHQRKIKLYSRKVLCKCEGTDFDATFSVNNLWLKDQQKITSKIRATTVPGITLAHIGMSGSFLLLAPMSVLSAVIDEEWQRTQCSPRETCVEVASELGRSTNRFFKPPCVNVFRCGGCCNEESVICMNTSTSYVSKQVWGHQLACPLPSPNDDSVDSCNWAFCQTLC